MDFLSEGQKLMERITPPDHSLKGIRVNITPFRTSHGRLPRGRGLWAFSIGGEEHFLPGMYTQAKKTAIRIAASSGVRIVKVLG